jgi:hypothetical protein
VVVRVDTPDYNELGLDELRNEAKQAIRELPTEIQEPFDRLLEQAQVVEHVIGELPGEQLQRIGGVFSAFFEKAWQPHTATV